MTKIRISTIATLVGFTSSSCVTIGQANIPIAGPGGTVIGDMTGNSGSASTSTSMDGGGGAVGRPTPRTGTSTPGPIASPAPRPETGASGHAPSARPGSLPQPAPTEAASPGSPPLIWREGDFLYARTMLYAQGLTLGPSRENALAVAIYRPIADVVGENCERPMDVRIRGQILGQGLVRFPVPTTSSRLAATFTSRYWSEGDIWGGSFLDVWRIAAGGTTLKPMYVSCGSGGWWFEI